MNIMPLVDISSSCIFVLKSKHQCDSRAFFRGYSDATISFVPRVMKLHVVEAVQKLCDSYCFKSFPEIGREEGGHWNTRSRVWRKCSILA
jgi:hypothetical protein